MKLVKAYFGSHETRNVTICVPHVFPPMADIIYGYIIPSLAIITICANSLAILIFITTNRKSPTNIVLTVLAFSNIFSIGSISPMFFFVYGIKKADFIYGCAFSVYHDSAYYVTSKFHCFSIWLTVLLGVERYIVVAFPMVGPRFCNRRNTAVTVIVMFISSFLVMILPNMWSKHYSSARLNISSTDLPHLDTSEVNSSMGNSIIAVDVCECTYEPFDFEFNKLYNWLRNILGTTVPCLILLVTTVLLIIELRINNRNIQQLHFDQHMKERREQKHMSRASKLIIVITVFFLLTELPNAFFFTWIILEPHAYDSALDSKARFTSAIICNLFVYIACTANFFILLLMSHYFREKLKYFVCLYWLKKTSTYNRPQNSCSYSSKCARTI